MKKSYQILKYTCNLPVVMIVYFILLIVLFQDPAAFQGLPNSGVAGEVDDTRLGKWLVIICVPLLVNGVILERCQKIELFTMLRTNSNMQLYILGACLVPTILWTVCQFPFLLWHFDVAVATEIWSLETPNTLMWNAAGLLSYALTRKAAWCGFVPLAVLGSSCLLGCRVPKWLPFLPSTWGMFCHSTFSGGVCQAPLIIGLSLGSAFVCWMLFVIYKEKL